MLDDLDLAWEEQNEPRRRGGPQSRQSRQRRRKERKSLAPAPVGMPSGPVGAGQYR